MYNIISKEVVSNNQQQQKSTRRNPTRTNNLNKTLQIDLNDKKGKAGLAKKATTKTKTPKRKTPKKKTPMKSRHGVRRNLSFDDSTTIVF